MSSRIVFELNRSRYYVYVLDDSDILILSEDEELILDKDVFESLARAALAGDRIIRDGFPLVRGDGSSVLRGYELMAESQEIVEPYINLNRSERRTLENLLSEYKRLGEYIASTIEASQRLLGIRVEENFTNTAISIDAGDPGALSELLENLDLALESYEKCYELLLKLSESIWRELPEDYVIRSKYNVTVRVGDLRREVLLIGDNLERLRAERESLVQEASYWRYLLESILRRSILAGSILRVERSMVDRYISSECEQAIEGYPYVEEGETYDCSRIYLDGKSLLLARIWSGRSFVGFFVFEESSKRIVMDKHVSNSIFNLMKLRERIERRGTILEDERELLEIGALENLSKLYLDGYRRTLDQEYLLRYLLARSVSSYFYERDRYLRKRFYEENYARIAANLTSMGYVIEKYILVNYIASDLFYDDTITWRLGRILDPRLFSRMPRKIGEISSPAS